MTVDYERILAIAHAARESYNSYRGCISALSEPRAYNASHLGTELIPCIWEANWGFFEAQIVTLVDFLNPRTGTCLSIVIGEDLVLGMTVFLNCNVQGKTPYPVVRSHNITVYPMDIETRLPAKYWRKSRLGKLRAIATGVWDAFAAGVWDVFRSASSTPDIDKGIASALCALDLGERHWQSFSFRDLGWKMNEEGNIFSAECPAEKIPGNVERWKVCVQFCGDIYNETSNTYNLYVKNGEGEYVPNKKPWFSCKYDDIEDYLPLSYRGVKPRIALARLNSTDFYADSCILSHCEEVQEVILFDESQAEVLSNWQKRFECQVSVVLLDTKVPLGERDRMILEDWANQDPALYLQQIENCELSRRVFSDEDLNELLKALGFYDTRPWVNYAELTDPDNGLAARLSEHPGFVNLLLPGGYDRSTNRPDLVSNKLQPLLNEAQMAKYAIGLSRYLRRRGFLDSGVRGIFELEQLVRDCPE